MFPFRVQRQGTQTQKRAKAMNEKTAAFPADAYFRQLKRRGRITMCQLPLSAAMLLAAPVGFTVRPRHRNNPGPQSRHRHTLEVGRTRATDQGLGRFKPTTKTMCAYTAMRVPLSASLGWTNYLRARGADGSTATQHFQRPLLRTYPSDTISWGSNRAVPPGPESVPASPQGPE